ncbi:hypothetical protein RIB2604_01806990 [Aspergillus luchuensis]|uniref:Uncharacterized protein n=1 Tax=Aspergillus kawachii TaxID=1069201 RepID=A0A146FG89_ASPKA|nr:hypothetical protein RIB2604_01806990 [Aspergillus luchuensis]
MSSSSGDSRLNNKFKNACYNGDLQAVQSALASGRLSAKDLDLGLRQANSEGHLDVIAALFDAGVPMSPLAIAYLIGDNGQQDPRVIRLYLDRGLKPQKCVDPNRSGPRKISPLASALNKVCDDGGATFDLLVEYGAKVDSSLLFYALSSSYDTALKARFLFSRGFDPLTATSSDWGTPLHIAARFADEEVIKLLLDLGADPTARLSTKKFPNRSPVEVAEWKMGASHESSGMRPVYQGIIDLLTCARTERPSSTFAVSESLNAGNIIKSLAETEEEADQGRSIIHNRSPTSLVAVSHVPPEHPANPQNTREQGVREKGSVSSRTRSRTKIVS